MQVVAYAGNYKFKVLEHAVNLSSGGYPQLVLTLSATAMYDPSESAWGDYSQYDVGITAYLVLAGKDQKPTKNCEQVKKVFGWDGMSFAGLDGLAIDDMEIQGRVTDEEYNGKAQKKVVWIDTPDAKPSSGVAQVDHLDAGKLAALDKQFSSTLKGLSGGKIATAKAPTTPPAPPAPKKATAPAPAVSPEDAADVQTRDADCIPDPNAAPAPGIIRPPAAPTPPAPKKGGRPPKPKAEAPAPTYDINSAWEAVVAGTKGVDDTTRAEAWNTIMEQVCPGKAEKDFTQEEWVAIIKYTIEECKPH